MTRLTLLPALAIVAVVLAACGGSDEGPLEPTPTATNGAATVTPTRDATRSPGPVLGEVEDADGDARVNGERASQNLRLRAADRIETRGASSIRFVLASPLVRCTAKDGSTLELRPSATTLIRWLTDAGRSFCSVERGEPPVQTAFEFTNNVQIEVEGTLFGFTQATLRVVEGFVTYRAGAAPQRLGPHEEVTFSRSGQPGPKGSWDGLDPEDSAMVGDLQGRRRLPSMAPTAAERQSKLLTAMNSQSAVLVLLDDAATDDDEDFVWSYFGRLAETWFDTSDVDVRRVSRAEVTAALARYPHAVYAVRAGAPPPSPTPAPRRTATPASPTATAVATPPRDASPFYIDARHSTWNIEFPLDPLAKSALARFTRGVLASSDYYEWYSNIYGELPDYDALLNLLR